MLFEVDIPLLARVQARLSDNKKIFWVIGGSASGKSTVCERISRGGTIQAYDMDAHIFGSYMNRYTWDRHPASKRWFSAENSLDWILSLAPEEFDSLNKAANVEYLDLFAEDIASRPPETPLLVDGGITHASILAQVIPPDRLFCIGLTPKESALAWNQDPERASMKEAVNSLDNPQEKWHKFLEFDKQVTETLLKDCHQLGVRIYHRDQNISVETLTDIIMKQFGLNDPKTGNFVTESLS